jgi:hypothetical protein
MGEEPDDLLNPRQLSPDEAAELRAAPVHSVPPVRSEPVCVCGHPAETVTPETVIAAAREKWPNATYMRLSWLWPRAEWNLSVRWWQDGLGSYQTGHKAGDLPALLAKIKDTQHAR